MPKTQERYELDTEWRRDSQRAFWQVLEASVPSVWGELDDIARHWAEVAPGSDITGYKFGDFGNGFTPELGLEMYRAMSLKHGLEMVYVPGSGALSPELLAARRAWGDRYGLSTPWLSERADLYILQKHTGVHLTTSRGHCTVGDPPPIPSGEIAGTPAEYAKRAEAHYRAELVPHWGYSRVRTVPPMHHLEWTAIYQCCRASCAEVAKKYGNETGSIVDERTVEKAVKRCAEVIALPLRRLPRGRKTKR